MLVWWFGESVLNSGIWFLELQTSVCGWNAERSERTTWRQVHLSNEVAAMFVVGERAIAVTHLPATPACA